MNHIPAYELDTVRQAFPISQQHTYLNNAAIAPPPRCTQKAMHQAIDRLGSDPVSIYKPDPDDSRNIIAIFADEIAQLINAEHKREIVGVSSTSAGMNTVAQAIDWQPGDNIVFSEVEFPSNAYPWLALEARGVECRIAPTPEGGASVEAFEALVDERTRLITASAVQYLTGHRTDMATLGAYCHERGILFAVDSIQAVGHMPFDVQTMHIDIMASGGQKSLLGVPGQGFLYVRDDLCETLQPRFIGSTSVKNWEHWANYDLTPLRGALRFMMGTFNAIGMAAIVASVRFLRDLGIPHIDDWTNYLSQVAIQDLTARGYTVITPTEPARLGPIVTFRVGDPDDIQRANTDADRLLAHLLANDIHVAKHWDKQGRPHLRLSTHCYNTEKDVRRVGAILESKKHGQ